VLPAITVSSCTGCGGTTGVFSSNVVPSANNTYALGTSSLRWTDLYAQFGNFSSNVTISGNNTVTGTTTTGGLSVTGVSGTSLAGFINIASATWVSGLDTTPSSMILSCGTGEAIKSIRVLHGVVFSATCGAP
jgi:hypothetical protein